MAIQIDSRGFIVGERRLKEMADGITKTEDNTKQILEVLQQSIESLRDEFSKSTEIQSNIFERQNRSGRSNVADSTLDQAVKKTVEASRDSIEIVDRVLDKTRRIQQSGLDDLSGGSSSVKNRVAKDAQRDSKGRFVGSGGLNALDGNGIKALGSIKSIIPIGMGGADAGGIDPTVDAVKELTSFMSPVGRVFRGMGAKAIGLFRGRVKKRRADEVLPQEQVQANKVQERNDNKRNKLLQRLINAVVSSGNGGMLGGLGGLFGRGAKGGKGLLKGLLRKVPILGALLGGGMLAKDWGGLDSGGKGKGIGTILGTVIGGALGSFLGIGGTIAGGTLGAYLGGIFGEKVGKWTDSLKGIEWSKLFTDTIALLFDSGKGALKTLASPFGFVGNGMSGLLNSAKNFVSGAFGGGGASGGFGGSMGEPSVKGKLSRDKIASISRVANNIGVDPNDLASLISFETVGMFSPSAKNPKSSATGLIQFMAGTGGKKGKYYGMSRDEFANLSFDEQMNYVQRYFQERGFDGKRKRSLGDAYDAVAGYGYKKGTKAYELNKVWDTNKNGVVEKGEAVHAKRFQAHRKQWIPKESQSVRTRGLPNAKGIPLRADISPVPIKAPVPPIKIPNVKAELKKMGNKTTDKASSPPSDSGISQVVSDRSLAHVFSGSIGFDKNGA